MSERDIAPEVLMFIGRFSHDHEGEREQVIKCLTEGACYWFAFILHQRFMAYNPRLMIDYDARHFGCEIAGRVYDITGDATDKFTWKPWLECRDAALIKRITEYAIMF